VRRDDSSLALADVAAVGEDALLVHDAHADNPSLAFELAQLAPAPIGPTPIGVFRDVERPVYAEALMREREEARGRIDPGDLDRLLKSGYTWSVG
jgi:2-oxoglutarate ferredoxin oxidoreductase subunit beta